MKKTVLLLLSFMLLFGLFAAMPAASEESDLYYINAPILKIFPHRLGYYIIYRRNGLQTGEYFIPTKWFDRRDQRAILNLLDTGKVAPYISIVMKKGEFEHIAIYASKDTGNQTWGVLDGSAAELDEKFNTEKLDLKF